MNEHDNCGNCRFFWSNPERNGMSGLCRRYPPQMVFQHGEKHHEGSVSLWPEMSFEDQCGEFKPTK